MQINSKISNVVPRTGVRGGFPNVRVSSYQTGVLTTEVSSVVVDHPAGVPIGLLLVLTYDGSLSDTSGGTSLVFRGDQRPNVNIR